MVESGKGGSIINVSSASSGPPLSRVFTYSVTKGGVNQITQFLAREWAAYKVRVNAIRPGFFPPSRTAPCSPRIAWPKSWSHADEALRRSERAGGRRAVPGLGEGVVVCHGNHPHVDGGFLAQTI